MFRYKRRPNVSKEERRDFHDRFHRRLHELHHRQFLRHYTYFRYLRPVGIVFNLIILYLLLSWVGIKEAGLFFVIVIGCKEIIQLVFLLRLEKRILKPMQDLKQGLEEVAKGNYNTTIQYNKPNDLELLITAFNEMTEKLAAGEKLQAEYEENRKALVANISHDIKTPITAIQGYMEALLEGRASTAAREKYLQTIYNNTVYVNKLIDDLFLFSKLDMQKLEMNFIRTDLQAFMQDAMEEYQFNFSEQGIGFQYTVLLSGKYGIMLDGKRFHQALNNIITNAVHHGPEDGLAIRVTLCRQQQFLNIIVEDNGPGIPEDQLPFIFNRFYRIHSERTKDISSTGLGLAIAKEFVEAHGGKITAANHGKGARFTIMLPILPEEGGCHEADSNH